MGSAYGQVAAQIKAQADAWWAGLTPEQRKIPANIARYEQAGGFAGALEEKANWGSDELASSLTGGRVGGEQGITREQALDMARAAAVIGTAGVVGSAAAAGEAGGAYAAGQGGAYSLAPTAGAEGGLAAYGGAGLGSSAGIGAGTGTAAGWGTGAQWAGAVLPSVLGYAGAKKMGEAQEAETQRLRELAAQYTAMGAPYRQRLADLYANPEAYMNSPEVQRQVQMGTDALARSLSTQGNPIGSGNALQQLQNYATEQYWGRLGQERDRMAGYGGLAQYQAAAPNIAAGASGVNPYDIQRYNAIGAGVSNLANLYATPKPSSFDRYWENRAKSEGY